MRKLTFILSAIFISLTSCSNDESTFEEDNAIISKMQQELITMSKIDSENCTNPNEWDFTPLSSLCGDYYIIYSKKIDKNAFLKKVASYNKANERFKKKWKPLCDYMYNGSSDNSIFPPKPSGIECMEGKARFKYENQPN